MRTLIGYISTILILICLVGCNSETSLLEDSRFNGHFVYSNYWRDSDGIEEINEYYSYTFDGTNICWYYFNYEKYRKSTGWSKNKGDFDYLIELDDSKTHFRTRLCDYDGEPYGEWSDWKKYEFVDGGNTLRIWDFPVKYPDSYNDYIKK